MKKVRYLTVSRSAIEVVSKLTEHEKALFLDILCSAFKQIERSEPVTVPDVDGVLSVVLDDAIAELESGFTTYMKRVNARNKADQADNADQEQPEPAHNQRSIIDGINDRSQIDNRTIRPDNILSEEMISIEQIKESLVRSGYSKTEINTAISNIKNWNGIKDPVAYVVGIIKNLKNNPPKKILAQQYRQRDYSNVQAELDAELDREMEEYMKKQEENEH